ncbi:MAG: DUF5928 domain-containing protein, partial [Pseudomonadota bacterium]
AAICLDPVNHDLLEDLYRDGTALKTLLIDCAFDDAYLEGHAERMGLIGPRTPRATIDKLMPTVAQDFLSETAAIRDSRLPDIHRIAEGMSQDALAAILRQVFDTDEDTARGLAATPFLFDD